MINEILFAIKEQIHADLKFYYKSFLLFNRFEKYRLFDKGNQEYEFVGLETRHGNHFYLRLLEPVLYDYSNLPEQGDNVFFINLLLRIRMGSFIKNGNPFKLEFMLRNLVPTLKLSDTENLIVSSDFGLLTFDDDSYMAAQKEALFSDAKPPNFRDYIFNTLDFQVMVCHKLLQDPSCYEMDICEKFCP